MVFLALMVGSLLCPVAALQNCHHESRWIRAALRLLVPFMFGTSLLGLVLRYDTLHLGRVAFGSAWVTSDLCSGAILALLLLLAASLDTSSFFSGPKSGPEQVPRG